MENFSFFDQKKFFNQNENFQTAILIFSGNFRQLIFLLIDVEMFKLYLKNNFELWARVGSDFFIPFSQKIRFLARIYGFFRIIFSLKIISFLC